MKKEISLTCGISSILLAILAFIDFGFLAYFSLIIGGIGLTLTILEYKKENGRVSNLITNIIGLMISVFVIAIYIKSQL